MYDEAKEKKEQMDDFRVEVRNFLTSSSSFLSLASSLSSESNLSNSLEEQSVPHFSTLDAKSLSPDRGVCRCTRTWRSQTCLNFKVVEEGTHENSNQLHLCMWIVEEPMKTQTQPCSTLHAYCMWIKTRMLHVSVFIKLYTCLCLTVHSFTGQKNL